MGAEHFNIEQSSVPNTPTQLTATQKARFSTKTSTHAKRIFISKASMYTQGSAKDTMINASLVAMEINNALPAMETPRGTEDYEGFYHLVSISGDVSEASLNYIVRDHDKNLLFEAKKNTLRLIEKNMNEKMGQGNCYAHH